MIATFDHASRTYRVEGRFSPRVDVRHPDFDDEMIPERVWQIDEDGRATEVLSTWPRDLFDAACEAMWEKFEKRHGDADERGAA